MNAGTLLMSKWMDSMYMSEWLGSIWHRRKRTVKPPTCYDFHVGSQGLRLGAAADDEGHFWTFHFHWVYSSLLLLPINSLKIPEKEHQDSRVDLTLPLLSQKSPKRTCFNFYAECFLIFTDIIFLCFIIRISLLKIISRLKCKTKTLWWHLKY